MLFIPWLILGAIKYIAVSLATLLCGVFTCVAYNGFSQPSCLDFLVALIIDYSPSYYMWLLVLRYNTINSINICKKLHIFQFLHGIEKILWCDCNIGTKQK